MQGVLRVLTERSVNARKRAFSSVHRNRGLPDNGTNTRIHRHENLRKRLDFPLGEHRKMLENTAFCVSSSCVFFAVKCHFSCRVCFTRFRTVKFRMLSHRFSRLQLKSSTLRTHQFNVQPKTILKRYP